jgi:8-oxo-dGTP pyrophosphatase MutT (NUDIX family)
VTEEMVDVVNDRDEVIGSKTKREAHADGSLHRCAIGIIRKSNGDFGLVRQASERQDAGQYVCPIGGHVSSGETAEQALEREAAEEVGFGPDFARKFMGKLIFNREVLGRKENHYFHFFEVQSDRTPVLGKESVEFKLFSPEQLKRLLKANPSDFGDAFFPIIDNYYPELK